MGVEKTAWNILRTVGGFVVGAATVFGWLNVTPEMVGQATYDAMRGPAPLVVMFFCGTLFGWGVAKLWLGHRMKKASGAHDADIAPLSGGEVRPTAAAASASTASPGGDPLAALVPAEVELLLRVFDSGTVRLDDSTLPVAKSLAEKGAIYRRDTHDAGVILNCDVMLSSDWVPVVRERADELRGTVDGSPKQAKPDERDARIAALESQIAEMSKEADGLRADASHARDIAEMRKRDFEDVRSFARDHGLYYGVVPREARAYSRGRDLSKSAECDTKYPRRRKNL